MFTTPNRHELGCGKSFSHADNMLGPGQLVQQKKIKTYSHIVLPKIPINSKNNCSKTKCVSGSKEPPEDDNASNEPNENDGDAEKESVKIEHLKKISPQSSDSDLGRFLPPRLESVAEEPQKRYTGSGGSRRIFPPIHIPVASGRLFLTKEHTEIDKNFRPRRQKQDGDKHRQACVQLDHLGPGDIIGLEQMRKPKSWEPVIKGYCLVNISDLVSTV
ncbi:uncharacterized protein LOC106174532 [Lingula anatina]|uniref:Uncharacterized protein LOC106174532 n=1 Tax=Lingula anatina TaxID=7574 RepID=A0A1S3JMF1_LINAN|nr:uncharacterized protein LOC106174532 [Lingula anatina]|eukprot:XP_013411585.1 uncharacterized protein LOC106174532 [Lingula anatina]